MQAQDIPYGYCHCDCGEKTELCPYTARSIGWIKGEPKRYVHGHQSRKSGPKYEVDENGCWLWLGWTNAKGYGYVRPHGAKGMRLAHRYYYEQKHGPIPAGMQLDHACHTNDKACPGGVTCRHRRCVNPDHLEPVTRDENLKRGRKPGSKPGRPRPELRKTHCKHGHEFTPANTIIGSDGNRRCRACQNRAMLAYYYRRKERGG